MMGEQNLLLWLRLLGILKFPLKVSLPSNYILCFISAFRQTAKEAFGQGRKKNSLNFTLLFFLQDLSL